MNCNTYQEQISQFIDHELVSDAAPGMFAHLSICPQCRDFMHATLSLKSAFAAEPEIPVPPELDARVATLASERQKPRRLKLASIADMIRARMYIPVPAAIMGGLLLLFSLLLSTSLAIRSGLPARPAGPAIYIISLSTIEVEGHVKGPTVPDHDSAAGHF